MIIDAKSDKHVHSSRCPGCGKLLTKPMIQIEAVGVANDLFQILKKYVKIYYGAQTKCRHCKKVRETFQVATCEDLQAVEAQ